MAAFVSFLLGTFLFLLLPSSVVAYIPAAPVNNTGSISRSDTSSLDFVWVQGSYSASISLQLTADQNTSAFFPNNWAAQGIDRGALVHFSEDMVHNNDSSETPWIAFISCDTNSSTMSLEDDIFTLARDRGAMAALLYSNQSEGCQISEEYINEFEKPLDVFTTHNKNDAIVIEDQFEQHCDPAFQNFAPSLLNTSFQSVTSLLNGTYPTSNTYLVAILTAYNATATVPILRPTASSTSSATASSSGGGSKPGTSLAMIILYAITGVITVLFMVVIISGAVRAIRHPERYGPRSGRREPSSYPYNFDDPRYGGGDGNDVGEGGEVAQTRTGGLARAIVDTFPIIKFVGSKKTRNSVDARGGGGGLSGGGLVPSKKLYGEAWEMPSSNEINDNDGKRRSYHQHSSSSSYPLDLPSHRGSRDDVRSSYHSTKESLMPSASPSRQGLADHPEEVEEEDFIVPVLRSGHAAGRSSRPEANDEKGVGKEEEDDRREVGESCAICLLEFEEGDDLRVLPCEGHHRFHQDCIDNWLLDVSGNCPLCRKDFSLAPTSSSSTSLPLTADPPASAVAAGNPLATRISRYLANVRSSRRSQRLATGGGGAGEAARSGMQQASGLSSMLSGGVMR